jgi:hypothetical protein
VKKPIRLMLAVLLALAVFGCKTPEKEPEKKEDPKTLDQRLIGGRWHFPVLSTISNLSEPNDLYRYYEFTNDSILINGAHNTIPVYSKNGIVYNKETDSKILDYEFHNKFPYSDTTTHSLSQSMRKHANKLAAHNDLITSTDAALYPLNTVDLFKFLVRFKEDGTPYQDYDE